MANATLVERLRDEIDALSAVDEKTFSLAIADSALPLFIECRDEIERLRAIEERAKGAAREWSAEAGECPERIRGGIVIARYVLTGKVELNAAQPRKEKP